MATWVYTKTGVVVIATQEPPAGVTFDDDFVCPSCQCKMYYKSPSSNGRVAHFAGKHDEWCDFGYTSDSDGNIKDYSFSHTTLEDFFHALKDEGVKQASPKRKNTVSSSMPKELTDVPAPKQIRTVRQLFNVLSSSLPEDELYPGTKVKDIYCGINTRFLYTRYVNGLHLVYGEYTGCSSKAPILFCSYPSRKNEQMLISSSE